MAVWSGTVNKMLVVPDTLQRNAKGAQLEGYDESGERIMDLVLVRTGLQDYSDTSILDVGCGVRFASAIINRGIDVKSYTGVEVHKPIIDFLISEIDDERFTFVHWDVQNDLYNADGVPISSCKQLPVSGTYDQVWLMSVFTHTKPKDTAAMLSLFKQHVSKHAKLVFTCFVDPELKTFDTPKGSLHWANYGESFLEGIIKSAGWRIHTWYPPNPDNDSPCEDEVTLKQRTYGRMYVCGND